jgi:GDP-D-mannose dehydratase
VKTALITGETYSDHEFSEGAFKCVRIDNEIQKFVKLVKKLLRSGEVDSLVDETRKAYEILEWTRKVRFKELVEVTAKTT